MAHFGLQVRKLYLAAWILLSFQRLPFLKDRRNVQLGPCPYASDAPSPRDFAPRLLSGMQVQVRNARCMHSVLEGPFHAQMRHCELLYLCICEGEAQTDMPESLLRDVRLNSKNSASITDLQCQRSPSVTKMRMALFLKCQRRSTHLTRYRHVTPMICIKYAPLDCVHTKADSSTSQH